MGAKRLTKHDTIAAVKALRARKDVARADLNDLRRPSLIPDDEHYRLQWHYPLVHLPQAWELTQGSGSVTIGVIDTGLFMSHPDLAPRLTATGYDFIFNAARANDGAGLDIDPDDVGDDAAPGQSSLHGTHLAATVAVASNNAQGVAGVAWRACIMPVRVLGIGGAPTTTLRKACVTLWACPTIRALYCPSVSARMLTT
jgi:serine protease